MTLAERLSEYVRACLHRPLGPVRSSTTTRSPRSPALPPTRAGPWPPGTSTAAWPSPASRPTPAAVPGAADPLAAIRSLAALATPDGTALLVLRNFHRFLSSRRGRPGPRHARSPPASRPAPSSSSWRPVVQIPVELEKQFVVVEHDLPGRDQLEAIARGVATEPGELPEGDGLDAVLDAAAGLTRIEAENAFSLVAGPPRPARPRGRSGSSRRGTLKKSRPADACTGAARRSPTWAAWRRLKAFCTGALRPGRPDGVRARGVLLLGPSRARARARSARRWATRPAGRRWSSTSAR